MVVASNLYDILVDISAIIVGSMARAQRHVDPTAASSMFEPVHGFRARYRVQVNRQLFARHLPAAGQMSNISVTKRRRFTMIAPSLPCSPPARSVHQIFGGSSTTVVQQMRTRGCIGLRRPPATKPLAAAHISVIVMNSMTSQRSSFSYFRFWYPTP